MSSVRVLVGTRKGAFILESDGARKSWTVNGPQFAGWEIYHVKGSPLDPNRLYASQSSGWFGQVMQRSDDGGKTWAPVGNQFAYDGIPGTHQWYDGTPHPWEFARVWHHRTVADRSRDTVYAGVEDAALFRSTDGGETGASCPACAARHGPVVAARRGRDVPAYDPSRPERSAAHLRRHLGRGCVPHRRRRRPPGARSTRTAIGADPDPDAEVGHCVHRLAQCTLAAQRALHAEALGRDAQRRRGRLLARSQRESSDRLRVPDRRSRARAGDDLRRADQERLRALSARRQAARLPQPHRRRTSGRRSPTACRSAIAM
jgi:hypothetical protein